MSDSISNYGGITPIERLRQIMQRLRDPQTGCPWDIEQTFETIALYTIEEAYEVADAIARGATDELKDELGDLLLQVIYHTAMAEEAGHFDFNAVAEAISDKMVRRHPHVFGKAEMRDRATQTRAWEARKSAERARHADQSALANVPIALPALTRAIKLQKRMSEVGFEWRRVEGIDEKIQEELEELKEARDAGDPDRIEDELGDVLFSIVNLARRLQIDPETALARTNRKFERRVRQMEAEGSLDGLSIDQLEERWQRAKSGEPR